MIPKEKYFSLGSLWSHIRVVFNCDATHRWNVPGVSLCSKFLIILDGDRLPRFHITEAVVLLGVDINPSVAISWLGVEGGLEGLGDAYFDSFCTDEEINVWDGW